MKKSKDNNKQSGKKKIIRRVIAGATTTALAISLFPTVNYDIAKYKAKHNFEIQEILNYSNEEKTKKIAELFEEAIKSNKKIEEESKSKIIESFTTLVIEPHGSEFSEDTIINMYAVASTEGVTKMSDFAVEHGWWGGDYNTYTNSFSINPNSVESEELIAHEQLHGILKDGNFGTGLTNFLDGYGINEALTTMLTENDYSYCEEEIMANMLGLIIGYDKLINYYLNSDLEGLKEEISQYISKEETNKLISNIDKYVFLRYYKEFLINNEIDYDYEKLSTKEDEKMKDIKSLLISLCEGKYDCKVDECNIGKLLLSDDIFIEDWDPESECLVGVYYIGAGKVELVLYRWGLVGASIKEFTKKYTYKVDELESIDIDVLKANVEKEIKLASEKFEIEKEGKEDFER